MTAMCLAVPAKIVEISGENAVIETDGVRRACNLSFVREPRVGDYVLLHAGFAIQKWTEKDFLEFQEIMNEIAAG